MWDYGWGVAAQNNAVDADSAADWAELAVDHLNENIRLEEKWMARAAGGAGARGVIDVAAESEEPQGDMRAMRL